MWTQLTEEQKIKFKEYCDKKFGPTYTFVETGEPLYFDENFNLINTSLICDLLFKTNSN